MTCVCSGCAVQGGRRVGGRAEPAQGPQQAPERVDADISRASSTGLCAGRDAVMAERRWYRDPALPLPRTEVTRFPHGVLEVKLSLPEGQKAPEWVADLLDSGYLTEVSPPA